MTKIAKTYQSTNGWSAPQSLSTFGIPISNTIQPVKHLGLEEFNFTNILRKEKLAYVPHFSSLNAEKNNHIIYKIIKLFYFDRVTHCSYHYANLYNVQRIHEDIQELRNRLTEIGLDQFVINNYDFQNNYGNILYPIAINKWLECFNANNITANGVEQRFILNVKYEKLEIFDSPIARDEWNDFNFASNLYNESIPLQDLLADINI